VINITNNFSSTIATIFPATAAARAR